MIDFHNKKIYFSGQGEKLEKSEIEKYIIQNDGKLVDNETQAEIIIQGYMTPVYLEDKFYELSHSNNIKIYSIEELEKYISNTIDIDSILLALKISKDQSRIISLLKNSYFSDENFIKILKYYDWKDTGIYDSDENRDVATAITQRFCSLVESNHNIQHSPIGIYYTALETTEPKLLEIIYTMPHFSISDKNANEDQPLSLKEVVALNPNTPKPLFIQILKNGDINELQFLAKNESISKMIQLKLIELDHKQITHNLIKANNIEVEHIEKLLENKEYRQQLLKHIELNDEIFEKLIQSNLDEIDTIYLSSNPTLNSSQIEILFEKNIDNANINLLKNPNCPISQIEKHLKTNDKIYNISIASNTALEVSHYETLASFEDYDVDLTLAYNPTTPQKILQKLYEKDDEGINAALSQNTQTPIKILMQLQIDNRYQTNVSNNETYKEFSRNSLGIISDRNSQFKRNTYMDTI